MEWNPPGFLRSLILPVKEIESVIPLQGKIIDMGCGEGIITKCLANVKQRTVIGVDTNVKRLPHSKSANLKFVNRDIRRYDSGEAKAVIFSDVLHHINFKDQRNLLKKTAKKLKKKGVIVIKEIDKDEFVRSRLSRLWDLILYPNDKIYYWESGKLEIFLKNLGFSIKILRPCRLFPGSTTLFICKK